MNRPRCAKRNHATGGTPSILLAVSGHFPGGRLHHTCFERDGRGPYKWMRRHHPAATMPSANLLLYRKSIIGRSNIDIVTHICLRSRNSLLFICQLAIFTRVQPSFKK